MSDTVKSWIEERRTIHAQAACEPWEFEPDDEDDWTIVDGVNDYIGHSPDDGVRAGFEQGDATAIVDAHNMLPRALDALNKVLELHKPIETEPSDTICRGCSNQLPNGRFMPAVEYPCPTVQAIEGAINE